MTTLNAAIPEDQEPEVTMVECTRCNAEFAEDADEGYRDSNGDVIGECCIRRYVYSEPEACHISRNDYVSLYDTGNYASSSYAESNCYWCETNERWFEDENERDQFDEANSSSGSLYDYHETNVINEHGWPTESPANGLVFGIELEMEHKNDDSRDGQSSLCEALGNKDGGMVPGKYILMHDGSLNESGVELISAPYTLDYHQKKYGWDTLLGAVKTIGRSGAGTSACGMHVHVNRKAISALTLGKMLVFVNANENTTLIERIAQRDSDRWAKRMPKKIRDGKAQDSDKYEALHLGFSTIEFRIFRGNLRADRVLKNIEFCHAVVSYCKESSIKDVGTYQGFTLWLTKRRSTYPNLIKFLSDKDIMRRMPASVLPATQGEI